MPQVREIAIDVESWPIEDGVPVPPLVCVSFAERVNGKIEVGLLDRFDGVAFAIEAFKLAVAGDAVLIFHNHGFDIPVLIREAPSLKPLVWEAYAKGVIRDTKERQKLIDLADGRMKFLRDPHSGDFMRANYTLDALSRRHFNISMVKGDGSWQLRFKELYGVPIAYWPLSAKQYAMTDAERTLMVFEFQQSMVSGVVSIWSDDIIRVLNEQEQLRAGWGLTLTSIWGLRTDPERVAQLEAKVRAKIEELRWGENVYDKKGQRQLSIRELENMEARPTNERIYKSKTFQRGAKVGTTEISRNMKEIERRVAAGFSRKGATVPRTPTGKVSTASEALLDCGDQVLAVLSEIGEYSYILSNYLPALRRGTKIPINPHFNLLLETGRTSCADPNVQNYPRAGDVRPCFRARDGYVYCSVDYNQLELCALGQVMINLFGRSSIADAINADKDLHVLFASTDLGISYDEALPRYKKAKKEKFHDPVLDSRQNAKGPNFGLPGGMGPSGLIAYMQGQMSRREWIKTWGHLSPQEQMDRARHLIAIHRRTYPDMDTFFNYVKRVVGEGTATVIQHVSGRRRGGASYCQFCNSLFQGLAADLAKEALWRVWRECDEGGWYLADGTWIEPERAIEMNWGLSPLFGSRPVNFVHDEIIAEVPKDKAHEAGWRMTQVMIETAKAYVPDVAIKAKPALMYFWYKDATDVYDANGRMIPWEPSVEEEAAA